MIYKRLERLVVTYVYLTDSNHMLYLKRDTTWATWLFLVQAVRLKPNIISNYAILMQIVDHKYLVMSSE